jgi:hypothetical protein
MEKEYTTAEAVAKLGMHTSTFNKRVRALKLRPVNSDPLLIRPRFSKWSESQLKQIEEFAQVRRDLFKVAS